MAATSTNSANSSRNFAILPSEDDDADDVDADDVVTSAE